jgi:glycoprotein endo-alpha-1,2-mannosidase
MATESRMWRPFDAAQLNFRDTVLANCREGANKYGRAYAVMYDLSGLKAGQIDSIINDWKLLVDKMKLTKDPQDKAYLHHNGKPVVAVWGIGLNDNHTYTLDDCIKFINFLKNDPKYGGCTIVVGLPTWWRTEYNDCVNNRKINQIAMAADIISPWTVGRFEKPADVAGFARNIWAKDLEWCKKNNKEYMPVAWPGFSWHNMFSKMRPNQFPRLDGRLLWKQCAAAKKAGAAMIYTASFDDLNNGTAILKCTNTPPAGKTSFRTYKDPSDYYLWLTGQAGKLMRGQIELMEQLPQRTE